MKQILVMLAAAACFIIAVAAHAAGPSLRPSVLVAGDRVVLGDLFDGLAPDQALVPVARAPEPGRSATLDAAWITRVALAYGVAWTPAPAQAGLRVVIRRADAAEMAALAGTMHEQLSGFIGGAPAPEPVPASLPAPAAFAAAEPAPAPAPAPAAEVRERQVPVLARRVRAGEVIGAADIAWTTIPDDRRAAEVIGEAEGLIGKAARRHLAAQQPLRPDDVQPPILVSRGETVAMLLQSGPLTIAARGRALDNGALGDVIRVVNTDSRRTIDAVVAGAGTVTVRLGASLASLP